MNTNENHFHIYIRFIPVFLTVICTKTNNFGLKISSRRACLRLNMRCVMYEEK